MGNLKFQEWFYGLPIWEEIDNYAYFMIAGFLLYLVEFDKETTATLGVALIVGLIVKGKGKS